MTDDKYERAARRLWSTFDRVGLDGMLALVDDDVVWELLGNGGVPIRGADALREYFAGLERDGRTLTATTYAFEAYGQCVVVTGSLRELDSAGLRDSQPAWVCFFDADARLRRAAGYRSRAEAMAEVRRVCGVPATA